MAKIEQERGIEKGERGAQEKKADGGKGRVGASGVREGEKERQKKREEDRKRF